jgi:hypothetical protein
MKRFFTSYMLSIPLLVIGVVAYSQASNPEFLANADVAVGSKSFAGYFLIIVGFLAITIGTISIALRIVTQQKR